MHVPVARFFPARASHDKPHACGLRSTGIEGHRRLAAVRLRDALDQAVREVGAP
jgi:hypothetical protein